MRHIIGRARLGMRLLCLWPIKQREGALAPSRFSFSVCQVSARQANQNLAVAALVVEALQLPPLVIGLAAVVAVVSDGAVEFVLLVRDATIAIVIPVSGAGDACRTQKQDRAEYDCESSSDLRHGNLPISRETRWVVSTAWLP